MKEKKLAFIAIAIAVAFSGFLIIGSLLLALEDKRIKDFEENHEAILKQAIETGNYKLCEEHRHKFMCVSLLARRDITICDKFFNEFDYEINLSDSIESQYPVVCRAAALENQDLCSEFRKDITKLSSYCDLMVPGLINDVKHEMIMNAEQENEEYIRRLNSIGFNMALDKTIVENNSVFSSYLFEDSSGSVTIEVISGKAEYITMNNETEQIDEFFKNIEAGGLLFD